MKSTIGSQVHSHLPIESKVDYSLSQHIETYAHLLFANSQHAGVTGPSHK